MASSLVKFDDPENRGTAAIWRDVRAMLDARYPEAALVAEWSYPRRALKAGFHADFLLIKGLSVWRDRASGSGEYKSLYQNGILNCKLKLFEENTMLIPKVEPRIDQYL
jgi:hypothetical protein